MSKGRPPRPSRLCRKTAAPCESRRMRRAISAIGSARRTRSERRHQDRAFVSAGVARRRAANAYRRWRGTARRRHCCAAAPERRFHETTLPNARGGTPAILERSALPTRDCTAHANGEARILSRSETTHAHLSSCRLKPMTYAVHFVRRRFAGKFTLREQRQCMTRSKIAGPCLTHRADFGNRSLSRDGTHLYQRRTAMILSHAPLPARQPQIARAQHRRERAQMGFSRPQLVARQEPGVGAPVDGSCSVVNALS